MICREEVGRARGARAGSLGRLWQVRFRGVGGTGVETALGVRRGINVWLGLATIATWLSVAYAFRYSSLAALIASVFGDTLDPAGVTFRHAKWWFLQPRRVVMAPDGHIWFHPRNSQCRDDFADAPLPIRAFVVHALGHV